MRRVRTLLIVALALASMHSAIAETKTFKNSGLKNELTVELDVRGKNVSGRFQTSEYGENTVSKTFSGEIVTGPKGKPGVYMHVRFDGDVPYSASPDSRILIWHLKIVNHRAHLFIPMQERSYDRKTAQWIVSDVELEPVDQP